MWNWKDYIRSRPNLEKNWNSQKLAFIHWDFFSKVNFFLINLKKYIKKNLQFYVNKIKKLSPEEIEFILKKPRFSKKYKCIFIHVPKCAGTSMDKAIFGKIPVYFCRNKRLWIQHITAKQAKNEYFSTDEWDKYFKFAFVRNPFDKLFSSYIWISREDKLWGEKSLEINKNNFRDFIFRRGLFKEILDPSLIHRRENRYHHIMPQFEYINDGDQQLVDFVGKFENLNSDWDKVAKILNIRSKLSKTNSSEKINHRDYYDNETILEVTKKYKKDFEIFNYNSQYE